MTNTSPQLSVLTVATARRFYTLSYVDRPCPGPATRYVHGLRCSKADFMPMASFPELQTIRLVSTDNPGCGDSPYDDNHLLNIDGAVELRESFVAHLEFNRFLLVGGSIGGLVALLYAERNPNKIAGFVNAGGNLAPEDCMFSSSVVPHSYSHFEKVVFPQIKRALAAKTGTGLARHLRVLEKANHAPTTLSRPLNIETTEICWIGFSVSRRQNVLSMAHKTVTSRTCNDSVSNRQRRDLK
jgi:pimeloyl-ACP methyl ester carboxylesterase